ncbi:MAG: FliG C-terminal domain-containing protein [Rhodospirillales bacterium]
MKITIVKSSDNTFDVSFDETTVTLSSADIKTLLLQATKVLMPDGGPVAKPEDRAKKFANRFQLANDVGVQNFIREADPDELLVLLKIIETDDKLLQRFYSNMSDNLQKMMAEDLAYKLKDGVAPEKVAAALNGLMRKSKELEQKGALIFEDEE